MDSRRHSVLIAGVFGLVALVAGVPAAPSLAAIVNGPIHRLDEGDSRYQVAVSNNGWSGFVTLWSCDGVGPPTASNVNFVAGLTVPNLVVVPVSASGEVCVLTAESATHLIADLNGWFPTPT